MINLSTQHIIVYSNPLEAAMWEGGFVFPALTASAVAIIIFINIVKWLPKKSNAQTTFAQTMGWIGAAVGAYFTLKLMGVI